MLTPEAARQYLATLGVVLPDEVLVLLVTQANGSNECLALHYDESTAALIRLYLIGLMGVVNGDRFITSERAPSGAARSYQYRTLAEKWGSIRGMLAHLDKFGCVTPLIPPEPTPSAGLWVGLAKRGRCDV